MFFQNHYRAMLFDMDGTLVDSAGGLADAVNDLRRERGLPALPVERFRKAASAGSPALLKAGLGITPDAPEYLAVREEFFRAYDRRCGLAPALFPGVAEVIGRIRELGLPWGIVTNKPQAFADKIVDASPVLGSCRAVVGARLELLPKPEPDGILVALEALGVPPEHSAYCGDDARDILAGKRAGADTIFAAWGYSEPYAPEVLALCPKRILERPEELLEILPRD